MPSPFRSPGRPVGLLLGCLSALSCLNDDNRFTEPSSFRFTVQATIAGSTQSSMETAAYVKGADLRITASFTAQRDLELTIVGASPSGTVTFGGSSASFGLLSLNGTLLQSSLTSPSGSVVFTTRTSKRATGTFSFDASPVQSGGSQAIVSVTNGSFDIVF